MVDLIKAVEDNDSIIKNSLQEQSYEMSPYRSDDDEDDDDVPNNKFMPSWARFVVTVQVFVAYPFNNVMVPSLNVIFGFSTFHGACAFVEHFLIQTVTRKIN
jgi:hypothetical protein